MMNPSAHHTTMAQRVLAAGLLTFILSTGTLACDIEDQSDDRDRVVHCNLSDPECAAMPELAEAIEVVKSIGIDPNEESVEIWVSESSDFSDTSLGVQGAPPDRDEVHPDAAHPRSTTSDADSFSIPVEGQQAAMACSGTYGGGGCFCCCWAGYRGEWGCECNNCW